MKLPCRGRRDALAKDAVAGLVLGVESVPDGLASGLLAGVNPLSGMYAYLFGTLGGAAFTSSVFMAVQGTELSNFTGYDADGANRILRAVDTLLHPLRLDWQSVAVGVVTIALILLFDRTRLGSSGLIVAVIATSAATAALGWTGVRVVADLSAVPRSLPLPMVPDLQAVPALLVPALSLAFVGLLQGAAISAGFPNPDGRYPDASRDFVGQGAANVTAGLFQGMPVGGSLSGTSLNRAAGARSRLSLFIAGAVMAVVIVAFAGLIGHIVMPALAGLLMLIGLRTVKPDALWSVWRTGPVQKVVLAATFTLTMIIPLQYAVLVGVGLSVVLHTIRQSHQVTLKRWRFGDDRQVIETEPPATLPADEVVVLQPYGSLLFAAARVLEDQLPAPTATTRNAVVILRLRGREQLDTTFLGVLRRYAEALRVADSKLVLVSAGERVREQLRRTGLSEAVEIYSGDERIGAAVRRAHEDAAAWVRENRRTI